MRAHVNGIEVAFADEGDPTRPAVILHHPLATDLTFWNATARALERRYRVVRFDARGHGRSDAPVGPYAFSALADDVIGLMDHLDIARAQFVGLSMGGMVAQALGLAHARRFTSLTIAAAGPRTPETLRSAWLARIDVVREQGMASQVEMSVSRWLTQEARTRRPDLAARCEAMIRKTPIEGYAGWCAAIAGFDVLDKLGSIELPVAVIAGAEDQAAPVGALRAMATALPAAGLTVIPGAAHFSALEHPDAFHAALLPFLEAHAYGV